MVQQRVTIIPTYFYPSFGGLQNFTVRLARELQRQEIGVEIIAPHPICELHLNEVPTDLHVCVINAAHRLGFWRHVRTLLASRTSDTPVLAVGLESGDAIDVQLGCLSDMAKRGTGVVLRVATSGDFSRVINSDRAKQMAHLAHIVVLNRDMVREVRQMMPEYREVSILPIAVDLDRFRPPSASARLRAQREMQIRKGRWTCLWAGRIHPDKRPQLALATWRRAKLDGALAFVGADESPGQSYLAELIHEHRDASLDKTVFLPARPEVEMPNVYAAADCFLSTSSREGMSNSVVEALCCGLPVVACDIPGIRIVADLVPEAPISLSSSADSDELAALLLRAKARGAASKESGSPHLPDLTIFSTESVASEYRALLAL